MFKPDGYKVGDEIYLFNRYDVRVATVMRITKTGQLTARVNGAKWANGEPMDIRFTNRGFEIGAEHYSSSTWHIEGKDKQDELYAYRRKCAERKAWARKVRGFLQTFSVSEEPGNEERAKVLGAVEDLVRDLREDHMRMVRESLEESAS